MFVVADVIIQFVAFRRGGPGLTSGQFMSDF